MRSPTWVVPHASQHNPSGKNFVYTEEEKEKSKKDPKALLNCRKVMEVEANQYIRLNLQGGIESAMMDAVSRQSMKERLKNDPELCEKLILKWTVGCRRLTPGDGYLEALQEPNCRPELSRVVRITENGIQFEKGHEEFDAIICATGFDISFKAAWDMVGRKRDKTGRKVGHRPAGILFDLRPRPSQLHTGSLAVRTAA